MIKVARTVFEAEVTGGPHISCLVDAYFSKTLISSLFRSVNLALLIREFGCSVIDCREISIEFVVVFWL